MMYNVNIIITLIIIIIYRKGCILKSYNLMLPDGIP